MSAELTGQTREPPGEEFDGFARRELPALVGLAWSLTGDFAASEEIAQDALAAAWRTWDQVGVYDKPGAWARRVVINRVSNHRRRRGREARALRRLAAASHPDRIELVERDSEVWAAVRTLPKRQAQAIALHYLDDRSVADIAEVLGCSPGTVKTHLHRGRAALARRLGLTDPDGIERGHDE